MKLFVLANPYSGRNRIDKVVRDFAKFLNSRQIDFDVFTTNTELRGTGTVANNLNESYAGLVIIGGDGTINEAINGLHYDIPISIIPAGTGNDFVKMLDLGQHKQEVFETAINGNIRSIDVGICNGRKFINGFGVGFDGQIVADMQYRKVPLLSGQAKYYYHVLHILSSYRPRAYQLMINGEKSTEELILLTVAKGSTFGGGFKLTPHATLDNGELAICKVGNVSPIRRYAALPKLQNGTHDSIEKVKFETAKSVHIEENPLLEAHIDGEYFGKPPFDIGVLTKSLRIRSR
ncbi:MAG: diacylglycerol kinase family lipid kinase [Cyclobacteriaceae bacterium]